MSHAIVTAVEAGPLLNQAVLMARSVRRFGGALADCPIYFVKPRPGPAIGATELASISELGGEFIEHHVDDGFAWNGFFNKPRSLAAVEEVSSAQRLVWLDADTLVVREPSRLFETDADFLACARDKNVGAMTDDRFTRFWRRLCEVCDFRLDQLPLILTEREQEEIYYYINSGVFSYRPTSGVSKEYSKVITKLFQSRVSSSTDGFYVHEQIALSIAAIRCGCRWELLDWKYNFSPKDAAESERAAGVLRDAVVLHYHYQAAPENFHTMLRLLNDAGLVEQAEWLSRQGPVEYKTGNLLQRVQRKYLSIMRRRQESRYAATCEIIPTGG